MSSIHLAYDRLMLRYVALKYLDHRRDPAAERHFIEEAQITGQLDHPNIVPAYDLSVGVDVERWHFAMKFVHGKTLTELIHELHANPSDPDALYRLLRVFLKVCDAVSFAHDRGVVHCDLKPDNVMVGSHGQVYVMDWGVAVLRGAARVAPNAEPREPPSRRPVQLLETSRESDHVGGTFSFMAPEQVWGWAQDIDPRTDIYGLGGILHYLLTRRAPHDEANGDHEYFGEVPAIAERSPLPAVPPGLCRIAERALQVEREARQQSVAELIDELETFLAGGGWFALRTYRAGETIVREGDPGGAAFIITDGMCEVTKTIGGRQVVLRRMGEDEVFGEMACLTDRPRTATVVALTDVSVRIVTRESLEQELRRNRFLASFIHAIAERFTELENCIDEAIPPSARSRRYG